jgi:hypothetical protein
MTGFLLYTMLTFCGYPSAFTSDKGSRACIEKVFNCVVTKGAYDLKEESKATLIVQGCLK